VFFMHLRNLCGRKSFRYSHQCRPKPSMDESDPSINQTANEYIVGIGYCLKDGENLLALRMGPPTPLNRLVDNRPGQPRHGAFGRRENHAVFLHKRDCFIGSHASSRCRDTTMHHHESDAGLQSNSDTADKGQSVFSLSTRKVRTLLHGPQTPLTFARTIHRQPVRLVLMI
jgi:hypothetical protein